MKKILSFILVLVVVFCSFGIVACDNNAGDVTDGSCEHSVNADGICSLCGKDILAKWRAVFNDAEKYKGFGEGEYTMKITSSGYSYINGVKEESTYIETIKNEKNKVYVKEDGSFHSNGEYYEYLPNENIVMYYYEDSYDGWIKSKSNDTLGILELYYGAYRFIGAFSSMVPSKIEYKDKEYYVSYSMYGGMQEYVITVKNDLIIEINAVVNFGDEVESLKVEINYEDVNIVLPNAVLVD